MKRAIRCIVTLAAAAVVALAAGCSVNTNFVYKPNPPAAGKRKLPVKVAVLPFEDGTEDFTKRGSIFTGVQYNLAKTGIPGAFTDMPPEFWGKSFADELASSGDFQSARFIYSPTEFKDEGFSVEGTLKKVITGANYNVANELLVSFRAARRSDNKLVWEKEIQRNWKMSISTLEGCGNQDAQCKVGKMHADWNKWMSGVLAEARADLVGTLATLSEGGTGNEAGTKNADQPSAESVDRTIDKILKGK